jgi:hypothetical protein
MTSCFRDSHDTGPLAKVLSECGEGYRWLWYSSEASSLEGFAFIVPHEGSIKMYEPTDSLLTASAMQ